MISPQFRPIVGGYERAAERLSSALATRGHDVTVIAERRNNAWPANEEYDGVRVRRLWCVYKRRLHRLTGLASLALFLFTRGPRFDVWHVHQYGLHAALAIFLGKLLHRPVVSKITNSRGQGLSRVVTTGRFVCLSAALHKRVTAVVALTRETASEAEAFGIPQERIHTLGNGVDTATFCPRDERERIELRQSLGIGAHPVVISVGRLSSVKNPDGLLRAWKMALQSLPPDWMLVLVGDGPMREQLKSIVRENELADRVLLVGLRHNVEQWLGASDVYVISSHHEGLSNSLLEALASGLPTVATRVSGVTELVEEPGAGLITEPAI